MKEPWSLFPTFPSHPAPRIPPRTSAPKGPLASRGRRAGRRSPSLCGSARGWRRTKLGELSDEGAERGGEQEAAARPSCEAALCRGR